MGLADLLSDLFTSLTFTEAQAEAHEAADVDHVVQGKPSYGDKTETGDNDNKEDEDKPSSDGGDADENKSGEDDDSGDGAAKAEEEESTEDAGGAEAEEEEEEEDEPVDPKPKLEEECAKSTACAPYKDHYEECVERVMEQEKHASEGKKGPHEDCVEEFFHLTHCATQCAAPKLFAQLK